MVDNILLLNVIEIAREAGRFIASEADKFRTESIEYKSDNDFVSYVDKGAEKMLVEALEKLIPDAGFITEENTSSKIGNEYRWIIDPLDGTTNFIHGLVPYAVSVALQQNAKTVLGVVHEIGRNETFYALKNHGAFLNGKAISVSKTSKVKSSLIATGFPYKLFTKLPQFMNTLHFFMQNSHGIRRLGSAATDLAYAACGRFEAFYEYGLSPWDVAAGALLVEEAGGMVCDFQGEDNYIFGGELIGSNAHIFAEFSMDIIKLMEHE